MLIAILLVVIISITLSPAQLSFENFREESHNSFKMRFCVSDVGDGASDFSPNSYARGCHAAESAKRYFSCRSGGGSVTGFEEVIGSDCAAGGFASSSGAITFIL